MLNVPVVKIHCEGDMEAAINRVFKGETFVTIHRNPAMQHMYTSLIITRLEQQKKEELEKAKKDQSSSSTAKSKDSSVSLSKD